ncbi:MAG: HEAT repeat domain-containing protein, partial [Phycisphaerae bacterium]
SALVAALEGLRGRDRLEAVLALGAIGDPRAADAIEPLLQDQDESMRVIAAFALALLGESEALGVLVEALHGKEDWAAFAAVVGLSRLGTPEAVKALQEGAEKAREPAIRRLAARALKTSVAQALAVQLRNPKGDYAHYAARALCYLNAPAALPALDAASEARDADVRRAARRAARRIRRLAARHSAGPR